MPDITKVDLSQYRLPKAREMLASAKRDMEAKDYASANNRVYYAIFHAMRAVLALDGEDFKKHSTVFSFYPRLDRRRGKGRELEVNMFTLFDVIGTTKMVKRANGEVFYSLVDFRSQLGKLNEDNLTAAECIITPYYICNVELYELYEYELSIILTDKQDFCQYLLKKTGRNAVEEIPDSIVALQRECHIEVLKNDGRLPVKRVQQYIDFLCSTEEMISQIHKVFGTFRYNDLWFSFY